MGDVVPFGRLEGLGVLSGSGDWLREWWLWWLEFELSSSSVLKRSFTSKLMPVSRVGGWFSEVSIFVSSMIGVLGFSFSFCLVGRWKTFPLLVQNSDAILAAELFGKVYLGFYSNVFSDVCLSRNELLAGLTLSEWYFALFLDKIFSSLLVVWWLMRKSL